MRTLTTSDLFLGLKDLLTTRRTDLDASAIGRAYAPQLMSRVAQLETLVDKAASRVNADELNKIDDDHDAFGQGVWFYTEAVLVTPGMSAESRAAAQRIRDAFIPVRSVLADTYAEEAARAKKNRPKVAELEADLKNMPTPDGKTLLDWVNGFLDAGDSLDKLLSERATSEAASGTTSATVLRASTIGLLRRFRESLRDEVGADAALARDMEHKVFAYIDELATRRETKKNA